MARQRRARTRTSPNNPRRRRVESTNDEPLNPTLVALADPDPGVFLNVVSAFIGFGEATGLPLIPMHEKLAEMAIAPHTVEHAVFVAMSHLAPCADDRVHAGSLARAMTAAERRRLPAWLHDLDRVTATDAAQLVRAECDRSLWLLEVDVAGHPLTAAVAIHDELGLPGELAGTACGSLEWLAALELDPMFDDDTVRLEVSPTEAGEHILAALDRAEDLAVAPRVPHWPEPSALLRWMAGVALRP